MFTIAQARWSFVVALATFVAPLAFPSGASADESARPAREVSLPVELKDPFVAYTLGLVPFYSPWAANYVGMSRVGGMPAPNVAWAGLGQELGDLALVVGGLWLSSQAVGKAPEVAAPHIFASNFCYALIPAVHLFWHAPYWARMAASFNKSSLELHGYRREAEILPQIKEYE